MALTSDTQRSLNTLYSPYNTTRAHSHNHLLIHGPVKVSPVNNELSRRMSRQSSQQKLLRHKSPTIEEEDELNQNTIKNDNESENDDDNENENEDKNKKRNRTITPIGTNSPLLRCQ